MHNFISKPDIFQMNIKSFICFQDLLPLTKVIHTIYSYYLQILFVCFDTEHTQKLHKQIMMVIYKNLKEVSQF